MENATKALIIAAAILIAIVLISLGVYVLGIGQNAIQGADMTESEITTFNAKFETYAGNHVMGSKVNALLQSIATNNTTEGEDGKRISVNCSAGGLTLGNSYIVAGPNSGDLRVNTGEAYIVRFGRNDTSLINSVTISQ